MTAFPGLSIDTRSADTLRGLAARDPQAAVKEAARQFESLFMQELLKSMRATTLASGEFDNQASQLGTEMLDAQYAQRLAGRPGGLADAIARQLSRQMGLPAGASDAASPATAAPLPGQQAGQGTPAPAVATAQADRRLPRIAHGGGAQGFVAEHRAAARAAEAATGIPADFMLAQAALESGWGRRDIRMADGAPSHNLFGIKAGANWSGPVAEVTTTEFIGGRAQKVKARFRAYASAEDAFADYARLMKNNPRYAPVLAQANSAHGFAQALQRAGYATDPAYADKLMRTIDTTQRLQRAQA